MTGTIGERVRERMAEVRPDAKQVDVAIAVGMAPDALSRALNGQRQFAAIELVRLAEYLATSMHWLATGAPDPNAIRVAARHTYNHTAHAHEVVDWDGERVGVETVAAAYAQAFPATSSGAAGARVPASPEDARAALSKVRLDFVRHFAEAVEAAFSIDVVRVPDVERSFSVDVGGHCAIVVPPHQNWFFQNWSIAHELGHFATQQLVELTTAERATAAAEHVANAYAAELLLPAGEMKALTWEQMSGGELAEHLWRWGVSTESVRTRLATLQVVPSDAIRELLMMSTQKVLRRYLPTDPSGVDEITDRMERADTRRFPASLIEAHTAGVSAGSLGPSYLAWMLDIDGSVLEAELAPAADEPDYAAFLSDLGWNRAVE